MNTDTNIFSKLDNKIITKITNAYLKSTKEVEFKTHSFVTLFAIFLTDLLLTFSGMQFHFFKDFMILYNGTLALFCLVLYVYAFYLWRVLFSLRKEGLNTDKNLFFAESANLYRKIVFYIALIPLFIIKIIKYLKPEDVEQDMGRLKYVLRADFYHAAGFDVLESIVFAIVLVETMRIIFVKTFSWSNKTHFVVVFLIAFSLSIIRVTILSIFRL